MIEYVRPGWRQALAGSFPRGLPVERWVSRLPLAAVVAVYLVLVATLSSTAMVDEAAAINAGRFTLVEGGFPLGHPALAAVLDALGGLRLARAFSAVCMVAAIVLLDGVVRRLGSTRLGLLTAAAFAVTPGVVVAGSLATADAPLIAAALAVLYAALRRRFVLCALALVAVGLLVDPSLARPGPALAAWLAVDLGLTGPLAIIGTLLALRRRAPLLVMLLLPAAALAVLAPTTNRLGAYLGLLLVPLAGLALHRLSRSLLRLVPVVAVLLVATGVAVSQSHTVVGNWADVRPVLPYADQTPGLSSAAETLSYYGEKRWTSTDELYRRGVAAIHEAVEKRQFLTVVLAPAPADTDQKALVETLDRSADYVRRPVDGWTVYVLINTVR